MTDTFDEIIGQDVFDIRDVIERFEELESDLLDAYNDTNFNDDGDRVGEDITDGESEAFQQWVADDQSEEERAEYVQIKNFLDEVRGNGGDEQFRGDWYPVTFIRDSYFVDYAEELIKDCGDMPKETPSYIAIDWEKTAENIRVDYSSVEVLNCEYWYR